jgi:hypothetical protein
MNCGQYAQGGVAITMEGTSGPQVGNTRLFYNRANNSGWVGGPNTGWIPGDNKLAVLFTADAGNTLRAFIEGTSGTTLTASYFSTSHTTLYLGGISSNERGAMKLLEFVLYPGDQAAKRSEIESNLNQYFVAY